MAGKMVVKGTRLVTLKEGVDLADFLTRHPDYKAVKGAKPSVRTMEKWDSVARATDGCKVEPDGKCPHGHYSWMVVLGFI
jgi:hypothetical protein